MVIGVVLGGGYAYALRQWHGAQADMRARRPGDARAKLDFCLHVWPRSIPVQLLAARAERLTGDLDGAEARLNHCLKLHGSATEAIQLEFLLLRVQRGETDEVSKELMLLVDAEHPDSPLILETLARAYMHNLRYHPALLCLDRWLDLAPDTVEAHHWRGWVLERVNNPQAAIKAYERALALDPTLTSVRLKVAEIQLSKSNVAEALAHLQILNEQAPGRPDVMARLGQCRFLQGQREEAQRLMEAAAEKLPDDAPLLVDLAKLDLEENRPAKAEERVRHVLKNDPADFEAQYTLVRAIQLQGRVEEAARELQRYNELKSLLERANRLLRDEGGHPQTDADAACELGSLLLKIGQERLALYWLHHALSLAPAHAGAHRALADHCEKKGDHEEAETHRRLIESSVRKAPGS